MPPLNPTVPLIDPMDHNARTQELFRDSQQRIYQRTDRMFAWLMLVQWVGGILAAIYISPKTWIGASAQIHWHVWAALLLGGTITALPVFLAFRHPGQTATRHVIAVAQMLMSALLIHLTGGRIETHFHVFGSLAFLSFYRDWRVLSVATLIAAVDHLARGLFWPQSVFGVLTASSWRWAEHAGWVLFEDTFLFLSLRQSWHEMLAVAENRAGLETSNAAVERTVETRTAELTMAHKVMQAREERFRKLTTSAPIGIFETDVAGYCLYTNPYWQNITGLSLAECLGSGWQRAVHPEDLAAVLANWQDRLREGQPIDVEFRFRRPTGEVRWVHACSTVVRSETGEVTGYVGTTEDVTVRKQAEAELAKTQKELIEASRQAGMAEVATGVLHNVGNVLNSVNVAATCVADNIRKSKATNLSKVAGLLEEHRADLGDFMSNNPKGKMLPGYLAQLAGHLATEQTGALNELAHLQKNIEHIKDIVSMQQNFAKVSGLSEAVVVTELVEDALRMNATSLTRHEIRIIKEFVPVPAVTIQKHKVLQILVNLVRNAKHACEDSGRDDKEMTLRVMKASDRVRISVSDNGVGIPPENLTRIFNHGFTTKKNGHGFGLHSGALAVKEMGGALHVHSDGAGKGATFTIELPVQPEEAAHV